MPHRPECVPHEESIVWCLHGLHQTTTFCELYDSGSSATDDEKEEPRGDKSKNKTEHVNPSEDVDSGTLSGARRLQLV